MSEPEDPKNPEAEEPLPVEVGLIKDPDMFEVGTAPQFGDSPMLVFKKEGRPIHALAFTDSAGEKLLQSFAALLSLYYGTAGETEERPQYVVPDKKKPTLH